MNDIEEWRNIMRIKKKFISLGREEQVALVMASDNNLTRDEALDLINNGKVKAAQIKAGLIYISDLNKSMDGVLAC